MVQTTIHRGKTQTEIAIIRRGHDKIWRCIRNAEIVEVRPEGTEIRIPKDSTRYFGLEHDKHPIPAAWPLNRLGVERMGWTFFQGIPESRNFDSPEGWSKRHMTDKQFEAIGGYRGIQTLMRLAKMSTMEIYILVAAAAAALAVLGIFLMWQRLDAMETQLTTMETNMETMRILLQAYRPGASLPAPSPLPIGPGA